MLFRLQIRRPRQKMDSSCMLYLLCTILREWLNNKGRSMPFALPMIWREPTNHLTDCCFCIVLPLRHGITKKKKRTVNYPNILPAIRPVPHTEDLPAPVPPHQYILDSDDEPTENREKTPQPSTLWMLILLLIFNLMNSIELHKRN